jgi:hypothetical protein
MMGTYKGNVGNLMQHWTLCRLLSVARQQHVVGLNYIDAHAMAPWARHCPDHKREFLCVRNGLPGQGSDYEGAWHHIGIGNADREEGYPSSAAFVRKLWKGPYSLLLCESEDNTANLIQEWFDTKTFPECRCRKLFRGDFRVRFAHPFPNPLDVGLPEDSLTLVSFDPDKYDIAPVQPDPRDLYREDLVQTLEALKDVDGGILMQISTYSRGNRNQNQQGAVISSVNSVLAGHGFALAALVWANGDMMSLVYARHIEWANLLSGLQQDFDEWRHPCNPR